MLKRLLLAGAWMVAGCTLQFALASGALAQATRTWVSGVGDDANPCSRTAPCKTFAGAISKTAAGGEINAIDPAGYGNNVGLQTAGGAIVSFGNNSVSGNATNRAPTQTVGRI